MGVNIFLFVGGRNEKIVGVGLILFSSIVLGACGNSNSNSDMPKETTTASSTMVSLEFSSSVEKRLIFYQMIQISEK